MTRKRDDALCKFSTVHTYYTRGLKIDSILLSRQVLSLAESERSVWGHLHVIKASESIFAWTFQFISQRVESEESQRVNVWVFYYHNGEFVFPEASKGKLCWRMNDEYHERFCCCFFNWPLLIKCHRSHLSYLCPLLPAMVCSRLHLTHEQILIDLLVKGYMSAMCKYLSGRCQHLHAEQPYKQIDSQAVGIEEP